MRLLRAKSGNASRFGPLCALCVAAGLWLPGPPRADAADQAPAGRSAGADKSREKRATTGGLDVLLHFADGRSQRIKVPAKTIAITTPYARLEIPIEDIRTIELAPRLPDETNKKVTAALARLDSPNAKERSAAAVELFNLRDKSFIALLRASKSKRRDLAKRAGELVEDLRPIVPRTLFEASIWDVIETDNSRFAGEIDVSALVPGGFRIAEIEANRADREVARWVLANGGVVWTGERPIQNERELPSDNFRIQRIYLHDRTAALSLHGPFVQGPRRIEFNRDDIDRLASLKSLTNLEFSSTCVTDEIVRRLAKLTSLERLVVCGTSITDAGLPSLAGMKRLNRLDLSDTAVTDEGLKQIATMKSLTDLSLTEEQHKWHEQPHPPDLYLNRTPTTEEAVARLEESLPDCQISASHLFSDQAVAGTVPMPPRPGAPDRVWAGWLLGYRIGDCDLFTAARPERAVRHTEQLEGPVEIVELAFNSRTASREWSTPLAELIVRRLADLPHLRHLRFGQLPKGTFQALGAFKHLTSLEFNIADVTDTSLQWLAAPPELTSLSFTGAAITGRGLAHLGELRQLKKLELVDCPRLQGTDLEALANLPALETLNLRGSPIDDSAVESLKKLTRLQTLNLSQTRVTQSGAAQLARALPKCKIARLTASRRSPPDTPR